MKVRVKNSVLQKMLKDVNQVKGGRADTLPILGFVKAKADEHGLSLLKTNLAISVERKELEGVTVEKEGECLIPAAVFEGAVSNMGEFVEISYLKSKGKKVLLSDENVNYELFSMPVDDYPDEIKLKKEEISIAMSGSLFLNKFRDVWIACSRDDSRKALNGVYAEIAEETINMAATDGKRLCAHEESLEEIKHAEKAVIPKKEGLEEVAKIMLSCEPEDIEFKTDKALACICFSGCVISFKLIDGNYPDWRQIVPDKYDCDVNLDSGELCSALKAVSVIDPQYVIFSINNQSIAIAGDNTANGHCDGVIPCTGEIKKPTVIKFHIDYILSYLAKIPEGQVNMKFASEDMAPVQFDSEGLRYWIMPLRIESQTSAEENK